MSEVAATFVYEEQEQVQSPETAPAEAVENHNAIKDPSWGFALEALVRENAHIIVRCPWMGGAEVSLGDAMMSYGYPPDMTAADEPYLISVVMDLLANRVTEEETEKEEKPNLLEIEQDETDVKPAKKDKPESSKKLWMPQIELADEKLTKAKDLKTEILEPQAIEEVVVAKPTLGTAAEPKTSPNAVEQAVEIQTKPEPDAKTNVPKPEAPPAPVADSSIDIQTTIAPTLQAIEHADEAVAEAEILPKTVEGTDRQVIAKDEQPEPLPPEEPVVAEAVEIPISDEMPFDENPPQAIVSTPEGHNEFEEEAATVELVEPLKELMEDQPIIFEHAEILEEDELQMSALAEHDPIFEEIDAVIQVSEVEDAVDLPVMEIIDEPQVIMEPESPAQEEAEATFTQAEVSTDLEEVVVPLARISLSAYFAEKPEHPEIEPDDVPATAGDGTHEAIGSLVGVGSNQNNSAPTQALGRSAIQLCAVGIAA